MQRYMAIVAVLFFLNFPSSAHSGGIDRDLVPDSETAIKIGGAILESYVGKANYAGVIRDAPLRADLHGDIWSVYPNLSYRGRQERNPKEEAAIPKGETAVTVSTGGGRPVIELSKRDGQVRNIYFAR